MSVIDGLRSVGSAVGGAVSTVGGKAIDAAGNVVDNVKEKAVGAANTVIKVQDIYDSVNPIKAAETAIQTQRELQYLLGQFGLSTEQMTELRQTMYDNGMVSASRWGKEMKEVVELQIKYNQATGRNIILGRAEYDEQFAINQLIGETGAEYTRAMQGFNQSIESAYGLFDALYENVTSQGLDLKKTSESVVKNLNIADSITFRNGTASLMNMAVWAEKIKFNVESIKGLVDKVTNSFEDTITMSAKLQVLGGPFAAMADPLAMMEEGFNDPEALAKRFASMIGDLATFDSKTGEFNLKGMYPQVAIRQYAEQSGISVDEARRSAKEQARRQYIESQLGSDLSDESKTLISSKAQYDKVTQKFYVTDYAGERRWIEDINEGNIHMIDNNLNADKGDQSSLYTAAQMSMGILDNLKVLAQTISLSQQQLLDLHWTNDLQNFSEEVKASLSGFVSSVKAISESGVEGTEKIEMLFSAISGLGKSLTDTNLIQKLMDEAAKLASGNFQESKVAKLANIVVKSFEAYIWTPITKEISDKIKEFGGTKWFEEGQGFDWIWGKFKLTLDGLWEGTNGEAGIKAILGSTIGKIKNWLKHELEGISLTFEGWILDLNGFVIENIPGAKQLYKAFGYDLEEKVKDYNRRAIEHYETNPFSESQGNDQNEGESSSGSDVHAVSFSKDNNTGMFSYSFIKPNNTDLVEKSIPNDFKRWIYTDQGNIVGYQDINGVQHDVEEEKIKSKEPSNITTPVIPTTTKITPEVTTRADLNESYKTDNNNKRLDINVNFVGNMTLHGNGKEVEMSINDDWACRTIVESGLKAMGMKSGQLFDN